MKRTNAAAQRQDLEPSRLFLVGLDEHLCIGFFHRTVAPVARLKIDDRFKQVLASEVGRCMYTSPVVQGRMVYFIDKSASAVQLPEKAGEQIEAKELWFEDLGGDFYASPVVSDGRIYAVNRSAEYFVLDAATGKALLKKTLDLPPAGRSESPNIYSSVCLVGKHLLVGNDAGETAWIEPGDEGKVAGTNTLPAGSGSTPVFSGGRMFVRGGHVLYCVEARK